MPQSASVKSERIPSKKSQLLNQTSFVLVDIKVHTHTCTLKQVLQAVYRKIDKVTKPNQNQGQPYYFLIPLFLPPVIFQWVRLSRYPSVDGQQCVGQAVMAEPLRRAPFRCNGLIHIKPTSSLLRLNCAHPNHKLLELEHTSQATSVRRRRL